MRDRTFETVNWTYDEETGIGSIELDRPEALNALSAQLRADVLAGFAAFEEVDDASDGVAVRAVVVSGAGEKAFCAGADVTELHRIRAGVIELPPVFEVCEAFPAPVIAKIDGYCLGGGLELALSCDFLLASERSKLGQPEIDLGLIPGAGGTQRLAAIVGQSRAKELCMTGEHVTATQAAAEGIVDYVHPAAELDDAVEAFASTLASKPPLAARAVKDVINYAQEAGLAEGRRYEHLANRNLRGTQDHEEGVAAFTERREPTWLGK